MSHSMSLHPGTTTSRDHDSLAINFIDQHRLLSIPLFSSYGKSLPQPSQYSDFVKEPLRSFVIKASLFRGAIPSSTGPGLSLPLDS